MGTFQSSDADYAALRDEGIRRQDKLLMMRSQSKSHDVSLKDASNPKRDERQFRDLLGNVFSHHELVEFSPIARSDVSLTNAATISKWFHKRYFADVQLKRGFSSQNVTLPEEEFFDRISRSARSQTQNNIQFLVGSIGTGKTTYVCNLLYRKWKIFVARGVIPIRINIDTLVEHSVPSLAKIAAVFYDQALASLKASGLFNAGDLQYLISNSRVTNRSDPDMILERFASLMNMLQHRHDKTALLIVDNMDFLYHLGDRGSFWKELHPQQKEAYEAIISFVRLFSREDQICANLGINVLYCVRKDTLEYMESKRDEVPLAHDLSDLSAYLGTDDESEISHAFSVIGKRFELLADLATDVTETTKRDEIKRQAKRLQEHYGTSADKQVTLLRHLWNLSRRGLRDLVEQMKQYSWLEYGDAAKDLNWRFSGQYSPSIIAYVLGGKRRYAQFQAGVPNLYLVNAPAPSNEMAVPAEMKKPHFVTYWLKRLIMEYLRVSAQRFVEVDKLVEIFTGSHRRAYPEPLVRYLLGHLMHVPQSECIDIELGAQGTAGHMTYVKRISLTRRGRFLIETFADSFTYLQLVVDDWRLQIPKALENEWEYGDVDYGYLVSDLYKDLVPKVLIHKSRQTILFAIFLEEFLETERRLFPNVFRRLYASNVQLPRKGDIVERVRRDLDRITSNLSIGVREKAYGVYCSSAFINSQRDQVKVLVRDIAEPHDELQKLAYN